MPRVDELSQRLAALAADGLLRSSEVPAVGVDSTFLVACTNDYLGLGRQPVSRETLPEAALGAGASRLIHGTHPEHLRLEELIADWVRAPSALLFTSGYAANVGAVAALCDPDTYVVSDALNHASLIDGCRLSRAAVAVSKHCDLDHVESLLRSGQRYPARWVLTESYFSMDGDSPDLAQLRRLCDRLDANLLVDEAHALGLYGPEGAGLCAATDVRPDVLIGTLGKAAGASGAFVAGSQPLRQWLWNRARSFVYSTAPSPLVVALLTRNVDAVRRADRTRAELLERSSQLRSLLRAAGADLPPDNHGPILPIVLGDPTRCMAAAQYLENRGILVQAIRPPTVPPGSSRLRVTVTASMTLHDLERLAAALVEALAHV